ncbi:Glutamyl-tRNA amidotransferase, partial [Dysosmobacter welbionis]
THGLIGKVPRHVRLQGIDILLRSGLPKKSQGDGECLSHLRRGGRHRRKTGGRDQSQHRLHQKARLIADEVRPAQDLHLLTGDGQFLLRLPEGALLRRLPRLHPAPGETHLPGLAVQ